MELRQLETFRVVMVTLNMTAAARQVYLSPAAVSLQIKHLSDELGAELFTRVGRRLVPTSAANRLQQHLGPLMDVLQHIHEDFPPEIEFDTRPFVLATGLTTLIYQLPRPLSELRKKFSRNNIQVRIGTTETIVRGLESKQVDLGIVSLPLQAPGVKLTPLFKEEMLLLMHVRAAKQYGRKVNVQNLPNIPLILYPSGATRDIVDRMAQSHGISLQVTMEVDDTEAIKKLVEAGFGASILPEKALQKSPLLRAFRIEGGRPYREVALATGRSAYPRKLTSAMVEFLHAKLGARTGD
jgi:DNA-binding transcriptional LysR family regulator